MDYRRRLHARLLELRGPICQQGDNLWLCRLDPWTPASNLPHRCHLCGECDTVSPTKPTGTARCAQCSRVAACLWPEPGAGPRRRTEEEALQRRIHCASTPLHGQAGPAAAALLWMHLHLRDPTCVAPLLHVFAPRPHLTPHIAEPVAQCPAKGGTGRSMSEPAAGRKRQPSGA